MSDRLAAHERIGLSFSGGKDSLACVRMFKKHLSRIRIYHVDTGDLLPEMCASVAAVEAYAPDFVRIETRVADWIAVHGLPTDLVPHSAHPVGRAMGENRASLVARYDCCYANLMWPVFDRASRDGCTLLIRGTKRADMRRLPAEDGEIVAGVELYYPLLDWSNEQVRAFLALEGVKLPRIYDTVANAPECARCSAWWGEGRAAYLKRYHPELWRDYDTRLQVIIDEIALPLANLRREAGVD